MAAKTSLSLRSPLTRVMGSIARKNLLIIIVGGLVAGAIYLFLQRFGLNNHIIAIAAITSAVASQLVASLILNKRSIQLQLAPIDNALENISELSAGAHNESHDGSVEFRISRTHDMLKSLQAASAKALLDAKLINVKLNHLNEVFNTLPFGVMVFDDEAKVVFANRALSPLLGQKSNQLSGKKLTDWCDIPELLEYLSQRFFNKKHSANHLTVCHPQRPNRWMKVEVRDLNTSAGVAGIACFYDSTDAVQAQKARGEFVTSLSHELKTPLHTMNLFAETLRGPEGEDNEIRLDAANVIGDEIERIDSLIRNLLDATRIETGSLNLDRTRVRLPELLNDCLQRIQANLADRQITLVSNIPNAMQSVFLDKTMFTVALNNLLSNGVKYNRDQGTLTVDMTENDDAVTISIADTGVGIPEKELPYIFDKFYRASNVGKDGHGVGLSLAKEIIAKHDGRLTVTSNEGKGTTFTLVLNKTAAMTREAA